MKKTSLTIRVFSFLCLITCVFVCYEVEAASKRRAKKTQTDSSSEQSVLPRKGDIAVLVEGPEEHKSRAEATIVNILVNRGYRVVDEAKMRRIRAASAKAQAARYALYGEFDKIVKINGSYSVAATVIAHIIPEQTRDYHSKFFTSTASVAVLAVKSNGIKLGGKTSASKKIGYTEAEAMRLAVDAAIEDSMLQIF
jgi:hypothetical protein